METSADVGGDYFGGFSKRITSWISVIGFRAQVLGSGV